MKRRFSARIELLGAVLGVAATVVALSREEPRCEEFPLFSGTAAGPVQVQVEESPRLTVVSLNVARETTLAEILEEWRRYPHLGRADILFLQEVEGAPHASPGMVAELAQELGFHFLFAPGERFREGRLHGIATLSRYPVDQVKVLPLKRFDLRFRNRCRVALAATVEGPFGRVRTFNVHLDSRINAEERLKQFEPALEAARAYPGPVLIGGDFNTANILWVRRWLPIPYRQNQRAVLLETMTKHGFETPFLDTGPTFDRFSVKLDWIFHRGLEAERRGVEEIRFSDHRALWATFVPAPLPQRFYAPQ